MISYTILYRTEAYMYMYVANLSMMQLDVYTVYYAIAVFIFDHITILMSACMTVACVVL